MPEHKGNTDKENKVKLTSAIEQVVWTIGAASAGAKAGLEVYTQFVGNNSDISIEISDKSGKKFDTVKGKMSGNNYWTEITVPEKAKDELYAEVKLSKQGLNKKSNSLYLFPPVKITNAKWEKKTTYQGEILKIKADITGLADGNEAEVQIWEHHPDEVHEMVTQYSTIIKNKKIETEWEFKFEGTPDELLAEVENGNKNAPQFFYRIKAAGITADSDLIGMNWVFLELIGEDGYPLPNEKYIIELSGGGKKVGMLDGDGRAFLNDFEKKEDLKIIFPDIDKDAWEKASNNNS